MRGMSMWAERIDVFGKAGWLAVIILGFMLWWPLGLLALGFLSASGRLHAWKTARAEGGGCGWGSPFAYGCASQTTGEGVKEFFSRAWAQRGSGRGSDRQTGRSGNEAFDAYREETLRRLEEEQREFQDYLHRLRQARDKQEFDQFMAEQRNRRQTSHAQGDETQSADIIEHPPAP
ncbi:Hypothetical protein GbCGDNIH4_1074 [Granulibacter bethesdensis CGDNIH4]|nr:Hypothetical protein GbCGDNIH4_1074 [Granulibacter bethesdensis CGDNIH4]